jgi:phosphoribosylformimino-5-aminoimidazole carboxamide ribotide isomerase
MKIIPVMDILDGIVVHALKGERKKYKPIKSILCDSSNPLKVATTFKDFGFKELYIADLDSILRKGRNYEIIKKISEVTGLKLMVDTGINNINSAIEIFNYGISNIIIGTETLINLKFVKECIKKIGNERTILSLDIKNEKVISSSPEIKMRNPLEVALIFERLGIKKMIVLDLTRVGSEEGVNWSILSKILEKTDMQIITGGGIRNLDDIIELKKRGIHAILIATALHKGDFTKEDMKRIQNRES